MSRAPHLFVARLARAVAVLGLVAYVAGSLYALATGNVGMFQRFGSLGVAAAILFFTDRLLQIELNRQKAVEKLLHEYGLRFEALSAGIPPDDLPERGYSADFLDEEAEFNALRARAARINAGSIVLLTVATLQWGFGEVFLQGVPT